MPQHYEVDPTEEENNYKEFLLNRLELMSDLSISLRKSYVENTANREDFFNLVSLTIELWTQIYPKIRGSVLEKKFGKYHVFYANPRLLLVPKYENYLWLLIFDIRIAYEELGLTRTN